MWDLIESVPDHFLSFYFVTDSLPPLMVCHRFFITVFGFFMKVLSINECYCYSKIKSIAPIAAAD